MPGSGDCWSGRWNEYSVLLDEFRQDAEERSDLNTLALYLMNRSPLRLAEDNIEQAKLDLIEAERILADAWTGQGFHVPHFFGIMSRTALALYSGDTTEGLNRLTRKLPQVRKSFLHRVELIAMLSLFTEATLAIFCAVDGTGRPKNSSGLLRRALMCAVRIRGRSAIWAPGLAMMIEAAVESAVGRLDEASARWSDAESELNRAGMASFAASASYARGRVTRNLELVNGAEDFLRQRGIVCVSRFARTLVPGISCV